jgi:hypothetical protein
LSPEVGGKVILINDVLDVADRTPLETVPDFYPPAIPASAVAHATVFPI